MEHAPPQRHDPLEGTTADGMIVTGAHRSRFARAFLSVLDKAVEQVSNVGTECSIYVYGSVATGTARVGSSDVDLLSVGLGEPAAMRLGEALSAEFNDLCRAVEIAPIDASGYDGSTDEKYGNRVFLRHYCVHLAGPDVIAESFGFPADRAAARGFNGDIGVHADRWKVELLHVEDPAFLARRIARKTLLAISGLVSIHDNTWTTDRVAASERWRMIEPEFSDEIERLLAWSGQVSPKVSHEELRNTLAGVVSKVVDDFAQRIGLWGS